MDFATFTIFCYEIKNILMYCLKNELNFKKDVGLAYVIEKYDIRGVLVMII